MTYGVAYSLLETLFAIFICFRKINIFALGNFAIRITFILILKYSHFWGEHLLSAYEYGIAGTVIFCHSGTGIHYWIRIQHKMGNSQKILNERPTFWKIMLLLTMLRQDLLQMFCCWKTAKYCLDREPESEPEQEPELKPFQSRYQTRNKSVPVRVHSTD